MSQFHDRPASYLQHMRDQVPEYDLLQQMLVGSVAVDRAAPTVLDLGIGTGESASRFLEAYPEARVVGIDTSKEMLFIARSRLPASTRLLQRSLASPLSDGQYDAVISAFAIHHLDASGKQGLFARVHAQLLPGGTFVFGDVVISADLSGPRTPIDPMVDLPDTVEDQLDWLRAVGFSPTVVWMQRDLAVLSAVKPKAGAGP